MDIINKFTGKKLTNSAAATMGYEIEQGSWSMLSEAVTLDSRNRNGPLEHVHHVCSIGKEPKQN